MVLSILQTATKSWKTTAAGIIAGLTVLLPELAKMIDAPEAATTPNWNTVVLAITVMLGLSLARDGDKSSEDHGKHTAAPGVQT